MVGWPKQFFGFDFNDGAIGLGGLLSAVISCYQLYPTPAKKTLPKPPQHVEVFKRRAHNGKMSASADAHLKMIESMRKGDEPDLLTDENIV